MRSALWGSVAEISRFYRKTWVFEFGADATSGRENESTSRPRGFCLAPDVSEIRLLRIPAYGSSLRIILLLGGGGATPRRAKGTAGLCGRDKPLLSQDVGV
ncbi:hypothetical protein CDAR_621031 [Caerostris darwini]|uniref:Uncharacterized protein n=1 Tax=Caerostris darwini TaxID=1538125 RepID=A0AAV4T411_9ARAC|nr:hypothetical protein CDAR_621031 [Caerostris darwini]